MEFCSLASNVFEKVIIVSKGIFGFGIHDLGGIVDLSKAFNTVNHEVLV